MVRSLHNTAISSRESSAGARPRAASCRQTSSVTAGSRPSVPLPAGQQPPGLAGGEDGPLCLGHVVACPQPGEGLGLDAAPLGQQGFLVLHPQNAVGLLEEGGGIRPPPAGPRPAAAAPRRAGPCPPPPRPGKTRGRAGPLPAPSAGGRPPPRCPKKRVSTFPRPFAKATPPAAKRSAPGHGPGQGQLQYQVRAACQGQPGPGPLVEDGWLPPLDIVPPRARTPAPRSGFWRGKTGPGGPGAGGSARR